jgi:hypothetical protein
VLCVTASPFCAKSTFSQWCNVFQKRLLYSKLSLERQDNSCYHGSLLLLSFLVVILYCILEFVITDHLSFLFVS